MKVLLTGGAGYIGSHLIRTVQEAGHTPIAYDNLSTGDRRAVGEANLIVGDLNDAESLTTALAENQIELVIHLAAAIDVGESVREPQKYYRVNTAGSLTLLEAMRQTGVTKMVFSSTAAVYGRPQRVPIDEDETLEPINPYGASKLAVERMLEAFAEAYGMGFVSLRYFNVAGAHPGAQIGEQYGSGIHLIPLILQVPLGRRENVKIFGTDYDTPDGTCIRDYIHVCDLADAHMLAAEKIEPGLAKAYNLGNGSGFSVREVIETARKVTDHPIPAVEAPRRPGDPDRLVASARRAADELGWRPKYPDLETIIAHAWRWHRTHPDGFDT